MGSPLAVGCRLHLPLRQPSAASAGDRRTARTVDRSTHTRLWAALPSPSLQQLCKRLVCPLSALAAVQGRSLGVLVYAVPRKSHVRDPAVHAVTAIGPQSERRDVHLTSAIAGRRSESGRLLCPPIYKERLRGRRLGKG